MCMRILLAGLVLAAGLTGCCKCSDDTPAPPATNEQAEAKAMSEKVIKSDDQWRAQLTEEQYRITRKGDTERAFSGQYYDCKTPGTYVCVCCGKPLFSSDTKFDSGSGWPSFYAPTDKKNIATRPDNRFGMNRTEIICSHCGAHLGHVFKDGPPPTNLRYCVNSASLKLEPKE